MKNSSSNLLHPCCLVFLWTRARGGRTRASLCCAPCQRGFDDAPPSLPMPSPRVAWIALTRPGSTSTLQLLLARVTRITHIGCFATPQVSTDSSLRSFRPCCEGAQVVCLVKATDSDVLRQHGQRHEHAVYLSIFSTIVPTSTAPRSVLRSSDGEALRSARKLRSGR